MMLRVAQALCSALVLFSGACRGLRSATAEKELDTTIQICALDLAGGTVPWASIDFLTFVNFSFLICKGDVKPDVPPGWFHDLNEVNSKSSSSWVMNQQEKEALSPRVSSQMELLRECFLGRAIRVKNACSSLGVSERWCLSVSCCLEWSV